MTDLFAQPCQACEAGAAGPSYLFRSGCKGCQARAVARGPHFHRCRLAGKQDADYRRLLAAVGVKHAEVVEASKADKERSPA